ncbi:unnamed protein product [Arabidopsis thaliana]|uniref:J domain-containing protein n=1 Tax=Arabidopsis thaliana TaxID=3702 RepID=Q9FHP5_ARATH|nr:unnamed protein product [Arabidopsis thaliana]
MDSFVTVENKPLPTDMEFTMEEATQIVEKKLSEKDYVGAMKFINLFPNLDGRWNTMIDVYICGSNVGESDWYGVLGVDPLSDDETVKKHYKQLALLLHPDKNKCYGAEGAFKLVSEAWCLLSDKVQRSSYDQRRKNSKQGKSSKPKATDSSKQRKSRTFWTMCRSCKTKANQSTKRGLDAQETVAPAEKILKRQRTTILMCHLKPSLEQMVKTCLINFTSALTSSEDHGRRHIAPLIGVDGIFLKCTLKDRDGFIITSDRPKLFPMEIAERKLSENDYNGAKKFINKAQNLYPKLDGLKTSVDDDQCLSLCIKRRRKS